MAKLSYRMYILVKDTVPDNYVPLMIGHAVVTCLFEYETPDNLFLAKKISDWYHSSNMKKVICRVSEEEFQRAIVEADDYIIQSETSGLDPDHLTDCVAAFVPRTKYPESFKAFKLWKVKQLSNEQIVDVAHARSKNWLKEFYIYAREKLLKKGFVEVVSSANKDEYHFSKTDNWRTVTINIIIYKKTKKMIVNFYEKNHTDNRDNDYWESEHKLINKNIDSMLSAYYYIHNFKVRI